MQKQMRPSPHMAGDGRILHSIFFDAKNSSLFRLFPVERGVKSVEVFVIEVILNYSQRFAEALVMHYFTLAQELDRVADIGVGHETKYVVVCRARLLLCCDFVRITDLKSP